MHYIELLNLSVCLSVCQQKNLILQETKFLKQHYVHKQLLAGTHLIYTIKCVYVYFCVTRFN